MMATELEQSSINHIIDGSHRGNEADVMFDEESAENLMDIVALLKQQHGIDFSVNNDSEIPAGDNDEGEFDPFSGSSLEKSTTRQASIKVPESNREEDPENQVSGTSSSSTKLTKEQKREAKRLKKLQRKEAKKLKKLEKKQKRTEKKKDKKSSAQEDHDDENADADDGSSSDSDKDLSDKEDVEQQAASGSKAAAHTKFDSEESDDEATSSNSKKLSVSSQPKISQSFRKQSQQTRDAVDLESHRVAVSKDDVELDLEEYFIQRQKSQEEIDSDGNSEDGDQDKKSSHGTVPNLSKKELKELLKTGHLSLKKHHTESEEQRRLRELAASSKFGKGAGKEAVAPLQQSTQLADLFSKIQSRTSRIALPSATQILKSQPLATPIGAAVINLPFNTPVESKLSDDFVTPRPNIDQQTPSSASSVEPSHTSSSKFSLNDSFDAGASDLEIELDLVSEDESDSQNEEDDAEPSLAQKEEPTQAQQQPQSFQMVNITVDTKAAIQTPQLSASSPSASSPTLSSSSLSKAKSTAATAAIASKLRLMSSSGIVGNLLTSTAAGLPPTYLARKQLMQQALRSSLPSLDKLAASMKQQNQVTPSVGPGADAPAVSSKPVSRAGTPPANDESAASAETATSEVAPTGPASSIPATAATTAPPASTKVKAMTMASMMKELDAEERDLELQRYAKKPESSSQEDEEDEDNDALADAEEAVEEEEEEDDETAKNPLLESEAEEDGDEEEVDEETALADEYAGAEEDEDDAEDSEDDEEEDEDEDEEEAEGEKPLISDPIAAFFQTGPLASSRQKNAFYDDEAEEDEADDDYDETDAAKDEAQHQADDLADASASANSSSSAPSNEPKDAKSEMRSLMKKMQEQQQRVDADIVMDEEATKQRNRRAARQFLEMEAGEEDELGQLRRNLGDDDEDDGLDALDPTVVDDTDLAGDAATAGKRARLHAKMMAEDDEMMTEFLRNRFVNGDRYLAARAAALARARLGASGVLGVPDSWARAQQMILTGMDLSGSDAVITKRGSSAAAGGWYAGDGLGDEDDAAWLDDGLENVTASELNAAASDDAEGLSAWQKELRAIARAQRRLQQAPSDETDQPPLSRGSSDDASPVAGSPSASSSSSTPAASSPTASVAASKSAPKPPTLMRRASSVVALYGLEDETQNDELAAKHEERRQRLLLKYNLGGPTMLGELDDAPFADETPSSVLQQQSSAADDNDESGSEDDDDEELDDNGNLKVKKSKRKPASSVSPPSSNMPPVRKTQSTTGPTSFGMRPVLSRQLSTAMNKPIPASTSVASSAPSNSGFAAPTLKRTSTSAGLTAPSSLQSTSSSFGKPTLTTSSSDETHLLTVTKKPKMASSASAPTLLAASSSSSSSSSSSVPTDFSAFNKIVGVASNSSSASISKPPLLRRATASSFLSRFNSGSTPSSAGGSDSMSGFAFPADSPSASASSSSPTAAASADSNDGHSMPALDAAIHKQQMSRSASLAKKFVFGQFNKSASSSAIPANSDASRDGFENSSSSANKAVNNLTVKQKQNTPSSTSLSSSARGSSTNSSVRSNKELVRQNSNSMFSLLGFGQNSKSGF